MEYTNLGRSGLKVSKIILGCMSYGSSKWAPWVLDEEESLKLIKVAYDNGINTWDTANMYSNGRSEEIIGKALKEFGIPRNKVVIMTKVFCPVADDVSARPSRVNDGANVNQMGLSRKHIFDAVDKSLARLDTDYIDVLQIHRLDHETPPAEIMRALHDVVQCGKVRYIGASSMYAWEFARLQYTAQLHDWTQFISMQNFYNLVYREEEREMLPFCQATGVGVIPWSPLARGILARPRNTKSTRSVTDATVIDRFLSDVSPEVIDEVEALAKAKGVSMAAVATAWVLHKGCAPILGLNSEERVIEAVAALKVKLTDDQLAKLEEHYRPQTVKGLW